jgi:hypothetical protein
VVDVEPKVGKQGHIEIRNPDEREQRNYVSAKVGIKQLEPSE